MAAFLLPRLPRLPPQVDPSGAIATQDLFSVYVHTLPGFYYPNSESPAAVDASDEAPCWM